ncbi:MAG: FtsX-like permease family protein, partial [Duncaniella sp.]|nr:FtsX-like permease family protein [Duncaniella sp.]
LLILLALLIVPALNLSGMIAGRMDSRQQELGIRKSFGATRRRLISQVLWENLFLTIIGGIIGFIITWIVLSSRAISLFTSIGAAPYSTMLNNAIEMHLTSDMIFAPVIFVFVFLICVVLNIMSALIPAWNALRNPIVKSMK